MGINFIPLSSLFILLFKLSHPLLKSQPICFLLSLLSSHCSSQTPSPWHVGPVAGGIRPFAWVAGFPWNLLRHLSTKCWTFSWNQAGSSQGKSVKLQGQGVQGPAEAGQVGPGPTAVASVTRPPRTHPHLDSNQQQHQPASHPVVAQTLSRGGSVLHQPRGQPEQRLHCSPESRQGRRNPAAQTSHFRQKTTVLSGVKWDGWSAC